MHGLVEPYGTSHSTIRLDSAQPSSLAAYLPTLPYPSSRSHSKNKCWASSFKSWPTPLSVCLRLLHHLLHCSPLGASHIRAPDLAQHPVRSIARLPGSAAALVYHWSYLEISWWLQSPAFDLHSPLRLSQAQTITNRHNPPPPLLQPAPSSLGSITSPHYPHPLPFHLLRYSRHSHSSSTPLFLSSDPRLLIGLASSQPRHAASPLTHCCLSCHSGSHHWRTTLLDTPHCTLFIIQRCASDNLFCSCH